MAIKHKQQCGTCRYINREAYKGVNKIVCYRLKLELVNESRPTPITAVIVTDRKVACSRYKEDVKHLVR